MDKRIEQIAEFYGLRTQAEKAVEEMAELIVAIKHMLKTDAKPASAIEFFDELTDVKIMIQQLESLCKGNEVFFAENYEYKLKREMQRIERIKELQEKEEAEGEQ